MSSAQQHGPAGAVVVGVDGSESALEAVRWAAREAERRAASLLLLHAIDVSGAYATVAAAPMLAQLEEEWRAEGTELLAAAQEAARKVAPVEVDTQVDSGSPAGALRFASRSARLLVVGAEGSGMAAALGSVTLAVTGHAECPIVVVRGTTAGADQDRPVVVGVDGGPLSDTALAHAFDAAAQRDVGLTAVHVWSDSDMQRRHLRRLFDFKPWDRMRDEEERVLAERLAGWSERYPSTTVRRVVEHNDPARSLVEHSGAAQLVVVATRGRGGFAGLALGSTGLRLIQQAQCPVMLAGPESAAPSASRSGPV